MKRFLEAMKKRFDGSESAALADEAERDYVEIDTSAKNSGATKVIVRPFVLDDFADTKTILDSLRNQDTIALINIQPLKEKDLVELKRSINKLKKTVDAIGGDIAGFGDDYIVITPSFASIWRNPTPKGDVDEL
jgi:SepF-like predicted cell division protein (DUF552 family)